MAARKWKNSRRRKVRYSYHDRRSMGGAPWFFRSSAAGLVLLIPFGIIYGAVRLAMWLFGSFFHQ